MRETENGFERLKAVYPIMISVMKNDIELRHYSIKNYIKSFDYNIKVLDKSELNIDEEKIGFKGSPTYVSETFTPKFLRNKKEIKSDELLNLIRRN